MVEGRPGLPRGGAKVYSAYSAVSGRGLPYGQGHATRLSRVPLNTIAVWSNAT